eukprot:CAMPEP_0113934592 /NCGR_PEP_ID=MMETSP1339-20121228/1905_1 /TAXON_ID=94617 /ORGANISM="Fibrocapsa japonica" /LENGTH=642 /DNA_ID=CAMNT_0000936457 /DNA_START=48 /DNA_END=1976 /DNA_ORIENTATION=+ /assembly_acc=CAM_ASM_000762
MKMKCLKSSSLYHILLLCLLDVAFSVVPEAKLQVASEIGTLFCAPAGFGPTLQDEADGKYWPIIKPSIYTDGCERDKVINDLGTNSDGEGFILLLERGNCTFTHKALIAQSLGAKGLVVYNSLQGMYQGLEYGIEKVDYECSNGQAWVNSAVSPPWSPANSPDACAGDDACDSGKCMATNTTDPALGHQVCCAWDTYMTMGGDYDEGQLVTIPSVFLTMAEGETLLSDPGLAEGSLKGKISRRAWSYVNLSSFLLWGMGVATVVVASLYSAEGQRIKIANSSGAGAPRTQLAEDDVRNHGMELSMHHTFSFILMASLMLLVLFFFDLNLLVTILFCLSAASSVATLVLRPLFKGLLGLRGERIWVDLPVLGPISGVDAACLVAGPGLAIWWFVDRDTNYAWVLQDLFGVCLCILFLSVIRFPNIKVASVLLCMAFVYDIFFVFISPVVFGESVMVKVATGGEPKADPSYCEKYPSDADCQTGEQLPMLLMVPRLWDYHGGYGMLGLGDIVLPGLVVAFALRYDLHKGRNPWCGGFFAYMVIGYAAGLMMADVAVYIMQMGQPALLYLVPCTLGVLIIKAHTEGCLEELWYGYDGVAPGTSQVSAEKMGALDPRRERLLAPGSMEGGGGKGTDKEGHPLLSSV